MTPKKGGGAFVNQGHNAHGYVRENGQICMTEQNKHAATQN